MKISSMRNLWTSTVSKNNRKNILMQYLSRRLLLLRNTVLVEESHLKYLKITESQNGWGWWGPMDVIWSKLLLKQGHPETSFPGLWLDNFLIFPRRLTPQSPQATYFSAVTFIVTKCLLMFRWTSCASVCVHCLLFCHWEPLKRAWLHSLFTFPSGIYIH